MEFAQRPGAVVEVVRPDLPALWSETPGVHEGREPGCLELRRTREKRLAEQTPPLFRIGDRSQVGPEAGERRAGRDAALGTRVRDDALHDDEHPAVADEGIVGEDETLLAAVRAIARREIEPVYGRGRKPQADVVELIGLETSALQRKA